MVDALASDRSDQPFGEAVLPKGAWGDGLVADAHGAQSVRDGSAIDAIPITDHVARRLSPRECFGDLACDPVRGRMGCDIDPESDDPAWSRPESTRGQTTAAPPISRDDRAPVHSITSSASASICAG